MTHLNGTVNKQRRGGHNKKELTGMCYPVSSLFFMVSQKARDYNCSWICGSLPKMVSN